MITNASADIAHIVNNPNVSRLATYLNTPVTTSPSIRTIWAAGLLDLRIGGRIGYLVSRYRIMLGVSIHHVKG
jgi:hypothetical protein